MAVKMVSLVSLLLLLSSSFTFIQSLKSAPGPDTGTGTDTAVLDIEGQELQSGENHTEYYILPAIDGNGGGISILLKSKPANCPFYVIQKNLEVSNGLPIRFYLADDKEKVVRLSSDLNIIFHVTTTCIQGGAWKLGDVDIHTGRRYVLMKGHKGSPGADTVRNWFKIEKHGDAYKILYCPSVCSSCDVVCGNVGVFIEDGNRWLGLSDEPLLVKFKKV